MPFYKGMKFTEEHKKKLSEAKEGCHLSDSHKENIGKAHRGKPFSGTKCDWNGRKHREETKQKIKEKMAVAKANGWKPNTSGLNKNGFNQKHTAESRAKMSRSQTGKKNPVKSAMNKLAVGEKAYNWRGGITSQTRLERGRFLREVQGQVFKRDNYTCQICDQYSGYLHADHIKSWADYPELRFDIDNCRTLCRACHYYITFKRKMPIGSLWGLNSPLDKKAG